MQILNSARYALAACAALSMLAGCGGSPPPMPGGTTLAVPSHLAPMASPCKISGFFYFQGSCLKKTLPAAGATFALAKYKGLTLALTIPQNSGRGKVTITMGDATGQGDITGQVNGQSFSAYPNPCAKSSCPGTAFMYFFVDSSVNVAKIKGNSTLKITNAGNYPGKACYIAADRFTAPVGWFPIGTDSGMPSGHSLMIPLLFFSALAKGPEANTNAILCL
jgi:hypothetical protein